MPGIDGFDVIPVADRETIRFYVRSKAEGPPMAFYASSMSDGTLRALATLVAAFQILLPHRAPLLSGLRNLSRPSIRRR